MRTRTSVILVVAAALGTAATRRLLSKETMNNLADLGEKMGADPASWSNQPPAPVPGDQERLGQVLDNLITNALEALPVNGGRVQVTTACINGGPQRVALTVADTGTGIPPGDINRLFEPFYTTKDSGTGLGLFLAAEIVRAHGGEITVNSPPGMGTTVQVVLPC